MTGQSTFTEPASALPDGWQELKLGARRGSFRGSFVGVGVSKKSNPSQENKTQRRSDPETWDFVVGVPCKGEFEILHVLGSTLGLNPTRMNRVMAIPPRQA